ncbi:hypothetical protein BO83DRAFT_447084 [Aspergillus eucalypticola CBS 122712]|uniref:Aminoglycoside phosphotransferase domain-containing protein n=1 Tax=Aspergillus eucalypticola (strain CBS 122712 / IBT 29274) TaxID=1448314 RepID=A0A317VAN3_ASPEC|nr:uncharacterized protein BO83DRAFT_447084 [Aspergillus eucalypticola CBS 122712]PWY71413.1 hypothetical protein BO83DRAFT_447084 [Aspergillus eucalypticola CBS 122712]
MTTVNSSNTRLVDGSYIGRYNEKVRLAERRLEFNADALKTAVARSLQRCDTNIKSLTKLAEGGFDRVLQITMNNDTQLSTSPRQLAIASEVATLALLRAHGLPVPRVYAYSTDAKNPVGSEYIIMEKLPGRPLADPKLHAIQLPASGSIYYASDLPSDSPRIAVPDSDVCIGPSAALKWWFAERASLRVYRGPCADPIDVLRNPALKELAWLRKYDRPRFPLERAYRESMAYLLSDPTVLPLFLAARIPKFFQNYDDPESLQFRPPPTPDLNDLDEEKADVLHDFRRRHTHFFYLASTQRHAGHPWEGNNIPLQADLVLLAKFWHEYSTDPCPISIATARSDSIMHLQSMQEEIDLQLKHIRNAIGISSDGWTPPEEYEAACARALQIKADGLASLDTDYEREMTDRHWPFDDHNEDEYLDCFLCLYLS